MSSEQSREPPPTERCTAPSGERQRTRNGLEMSEVPRYLFDASLLFRSLKLLQIDQRALAADDPLLFRELQGVCSLCQSKEACARDFAHQGDEYPSDRWWAYCPNSGALATIGAMQNCAHAAQYLKMPHGSQLRGFAGARFASE